MCTYLDHCSQLLSISSNVFHFSLFSDFKLRHRKSISVSWYKIQSWADRVAPLFLFLASRMEIATHSTRCLSNLGQFKQHIGQPHLGHSIFAGLKQPGQISWEFFCGAAAIGFSWKIISPLRRSRAAAKYLPSCGHFSTKYVVDEVSWLSSISDWLLIQLPFREKSSLQLKARIA